MKRKYIVGLVGAMVLSVNAGASVAHKTKTPVNHVLLSSSASKDNISAKVEVSKVWSSNGAVNGAGGSVNYKIGISFKASDTKQILPIKNFKITLNPKLVYTNYENMTQEQKVQADKDVAILNQQIAYQVGNAGDLNTTSSVSVIASVTVPKCDYGMVLNPNIKVSYEEPNGESNSINVSNKTLEQKYNQNYSDFVQASATSWTGQLLLGINNGVGKSEGQLYNPGNYPVSSVTFTLSNSNKNATFVPKANLLSQYFKSNGNGSYTISGPFIKKYMNSIQDLFNLKVEGTFVDTITLTPTAIKYGNYDSNMLPKTTNIGYGSANCNIVLSNQEGVNSQNIKAYQDVGTNNHSYNPTVTYSSKVNQKDNKYNVYTGVALQNGQAVIESNGQNMLAQNEVGVSLTPSELQTMLFGNAQDKAQMFEDIINGKVGQSYNYNYVESGKQIEGDINFIYANGENGVNYRTVSVLGKDKGTILEKASTLAYSEKPLTSVSGLDSYDTVLKKNGKIIGFFMGADSSQGEKFAMTNQPGYSGGCGQSTSIRFGNQTQHNTSSVTCCPWDWTNSYIDGQSKNIPNADIQWLTSPHTITVNNTQMQYDNIKFGDNIKFIINSTVPMRLSNNIDVKVDGKNSSYKDLTLSNDGKTLTMILPGGYNANFRAEVGGIYFTTFGGTAISVNGKMVGTNKDNPSGKEIYINGQKIKYSSLFPGNGGYESSSVNLALVSSNNCIHYSTPVTKDNTVSLTNIVHNVDSTQREYMVAGLIPTSLQDTLTGSNGEASYGGLSSELESINVDNGQLWLLPKADYSMYAKSMANSLAYQMGQEFSKTGSPGQGWVLYKKGMNLSDYIGYFVRVDIPSGDNFSMTYTVKLTGISDDNSFQYVTSEFKYYDQANNVGSDSNIVAISANGVKIAPQWISSVGLKEKDGTIVNLSPEELSKIASNGKSLSYLNSKGLDNDGNYNNIPNTEADHLLQEFNMVTNQTVMGSLGYKLDGIFIDGHYYDTQTEAGMQKVKNWMNNASLINDKGVDSFKFIIAKNPEQPKVVQPVVKPEKPKVDIHDTTNKVDKVEVEKPKVEKPTVEKPEVKPEKPKTDVHESTNKVDKVKVEKPTVEKPEVKVEKPKVDIHDTTNKVDKVKVEKPTVEKPEVKPEKPKVDIHDTTNKVDKVKVEKPTVEKPEVKPEKPKADVHESTNKVDKAEVEKPTGEKPIVKVEKPENTIAQTPDTINVANRKSDATNHKSDVINVQDNNEGKLNKVNTISLANPINASNQDKVPQVSAVVTNTNDENSKVSENQNQPNISNQDNLVKDTNSKDNNNVEVKPESNYKLYSPKTDNLEKTTELVTTKSTNKNNIDDVAGIGGLLAVLMLVAYRIIKRKK